MKKIANFIILGSVFLIILGMVIFVIALASNKFNFDTISNDTKVVKTYEISEEFSDIVVNEKDFDINVIYSKDSENKIVVDEITNISHQIEVIENTLTISNTDTRKWYEKLFSFYNYKLTIYLNYEVINNLKINSSTSEIEVSNGFTFNNVEVISSTSDVDFSSNVIENIKINLSTGDIELENLTAKNIELKVTTGDVELNDVTLSNELKLECNTGDTTLENVKCMNLCSNGTTGDIYLKNVLVNRLLNITRDTGDITFNKSDALSIKVKTSTGNVKGSLLSRKCFIVKTSTGKKQVPESFSGGYCEITTSTGDVIIEIDNN